jgi:hypothetical protein
MLRISITENATEMRLVLQGRLTGLQVDELKTSWKAASQLLKGRTCKVDSTNSHSSTKEAIAYCELCPERVRNSSRTIFI